MREVCNGCRAVRPKSARWFYFYADIASRGIELVPVEILCPSCAPADRVAERTARNSKAAKKRRGRL